MPERIDTKAVMQQLPVDPQKCGETGESHEWDGDKTLEEAGKAGLYCVTCGLDAATVVLLAEAHDALAQEIANREALERQGRRAELALRSVKALVLEERRPENDFMNTQTRGHIADLCDNALMFPRADAALDAEETTTIYATTISDEDGHSLGDDAALAAEEKP